MKYVDALVVSALLLTGCAAESGNESEPLTWECSTGADVYGIPRQWCVSSEEPQVEYMCDHYAEMPEVELVCVVADDERPGYWYTYDAGVLIEKDCGKERVTFAQLCGEQPEVAPRPPMPVKPCAELSGCSR